ncbi:MAG: hypothetical protein SGILL_005661 [Bacillariaceae sp.]
MSSSSEEISREITTPTLLLDKERCLANIRRMNEKAIAAGIKLRPHCKTHVSLAIAKWMQQETGIQQITVSSLSMAHYFSSAIHDITVAFPVNIREVDTINRMVSDGKLQLNLLVENVEAVEYLQRHLQGQVGLFIKIDVGYGRTGIPSQDFERVDRVLQCILTDSTLTNFKGFLTHAGHSYDCRTADEIRSVHLSSVELLSELQQYFRRKYPILQFEISIGDTPTCSVVTADELRNSGNLIHEMRPGNFVFYDIEQVTIGSCSYQDVAVAMACPIVARHQERRELVLYGGGVHFSKDRLYEMDGNGKEKPIFGRAVRFVRGSPLKWGAVIPGMHLRSCSHEHGIVVVPSEEDFGAYQVGDLLRILPVHSCMTADAMKSKGYLTCDGERISRMTDYEVSNHPNHGYL